MTYTPLSREQLVEVLDAALEAVAKQIGAERLSPEYENTHSLPTLTDDIARAQLQLVKYDEATNPWYCK